MFGPYRLVVLLIIPTLNAKVGNIRGDKDTTTVDDNACIFA
jgi:hypothetical protein